MNNTDYCTSDKDPASSLDEPNLSNFHQLTSHHSPPSSFDGQEQIPDSSYADSLADPSFITSPFTPYPDAGFTHSLTSEQPVSWPGQSGGVSPVLSDSAAMDPSHLFLSMTDSVFSRYDHHIGTDGMYIDRCNSPCAESCRSQCGEDGEADICCDPNCDEISDLCTNDSCVDQIKCCPGSCPVPVLSENDEDAAATLASIGSGDQPAGSLVDGELSLHTQSSLRLTASTSPESSLMSSPHLSSQYSTIYPNYFMQQPMMMGLYPSFPGEFGLNLELVDDLIMHHNPQQPSPSTPHFRPCPLDNAPFVTRRCMLPRSTYDGTDTQSLMQNAEAANPQILPSACGVFLSGPDDVIPHIASTHPHAFNTLQSYLEASATDSRLSESNRLAFLSAIEAIGVAKAEDGKYLLDACSTATPSSTPHDSATPRTQQSDATLDTVDLVPQFGCKWQEETGIICGRHFDDAEGLHQHILTHSRSLKKSGTGHRCRWVGCTRPAGPKGCFPQRTKLERHLQTHTGFKPAECSICGLALSGAQALAQHMRTHTNETPWKCTFEGCGKEFKQQSALTMHMRTHTDEKPLACDICGKRFSESSNLSKHKKIHTRSFKCLVCNKDFSRADQLRKHEKLHEASRDGAAALSKTHEGRVAKKARA
ncbi:hypothetical protein jhhlp_007299 [Lomentospora prolificans]|uniref:C2H2-type domain-containing protein n=1 Tax=Lomentospora prolificans TaxID=41688 RepID=A0A2N3N2A0_9PEZI|nr:hypothetical protein jhhlp_007299 [Lomentospora prolificans]